ncbi:MAG: hypothetical protein Q8P64_05700, partial [Deltaproteobacteria bacterium]|nr:hypothetical protein [Deltaproteobacteria bacterium]
INIHNGLPHRKVLVAPTWVTWVDWVSPTSAVIETFLLVLSMSYSKSPLFSIGGSLIGQNSD